MMETKLQLPKHITDLTKHCLSNTYFIYKGQRYKQIQGAPMGSPLSPIIANLFMEDFEIRALENAVHKPKLWLRYVDDTFVIWSHGVDKLKTFLEYLNNIHPSIQFTMEVEVQGQLPFLDILVIKKPNGALGHTVYRKPTHTNRYLNAHSHHHPAQLQSVVNTLISRSQRLADQEHRDTEIATIRNTLIANGYTPNTINRTMRNNDKTKREKKNENTTSKAFLPYVKGTTDKIGRILGKHDIKTIFTTNKKISGVLNNPKDKIHLEDQGVYEVPCKNCTKTYIGQTNRRISVRTEEHKLAVRNKTATSSLAQHVIETGHAIDFENTRTVMRSTHLRTRTVREAIEIDRRPNSMNKRDDAQRLPMIWRPLLRNRDLPPPIRTNTVVRRMASIDMQRDNSRGPVTRSRAASTVRQSNAD